MRHDIPDLGTVSEAKPHLIMHGFSSRLGKRVSHGPRVEGWGQGLPGWASAALLPLTQVSDILRYLFPVPKDDSHRVITFANQDDYISFRWVHGLALEQCPDLCVPLLFIVGPHLLPVSPCPRHHVYRKTDHRNVELTEVGPRFELKCESGALFYFWGVVGRSCWEYR